MSKHNNPARQEVKVKTVTLSDELQQNALKRLETGAKKAKDAELLSEKIKNIIMTQITEWKKKFKLHKIKKKKKFSN